MKMSFMFTATDDLLSWWIRAVTGGDFSHAAVRFVAEDQADVIAMEINAGMAQEFYFESHWGRDPMSGKDGVRGPLGLDRIVQWGKRAGNVLYVQPWLPLTQEEVLKAYKTAAWAAKWIRYARVQIYRNWVHNRLGYQVSRGRGSADKWHCSETGVRLLPARLWPALGIPDLLADFVTPSGRYGLFENAEKILRGHTE